MQRISILLLEFKEIFVIFVQTLKYHYGNRF